MALQEHQSNGWINGVIGTAATAVLAWFGAMTRQTFANKGRLDVVDVRFDSLESTVNKIDQKVDRLIEHLLDKGE